MPRRLVVYCCACACRACGGEPRQRRCSRLFADTQANAISVDVELVIAVDVSYSMDPDEQALQTGRLHSGADLERISAGAAPGREWQDRHHLF